MLKWYLNSYTLDKNFKTFGFNNFRFFLSSLFLKLFETFIYRIKTSAFSFKIKLNLIIVDPYGMQFTNKLTVYQLGP